MITGCSTLKDAASVLQDRTRAVFAITLGKEGTLLRVGEQMEIVPSIPVNPVDTTGAGDAFVGAVLYQLSREGAEGRPVMAAPDRSEAGRRELPDAEQWRRIVSNANKAGARTCEYMGAMEAFKHLSSKIFK